jgi:RNase H-like domain found in reverse transcriptase
LLKLLVLRSFLFGAKIDIYTDHKNLTFIVDNTSSRVLRWRLLIEDFQPTIHHVADPDNVEANGLSCLPNLNVLPLEGQEDLSYDNDLHLFDLYLNYPELDPNGPVLPLDYNVIA